MTAPRADVGIIGGSGFYEFLDGAQTVAVATPYGPASEPLTIGVVAGRRVAFVPRHGRDHRFPAHRVPYRANLWALRSVGVRQVLAPCAVGALAPGLGPGDLVVPDQFADRTSGRAQTYFDVGAVHVAMAEPYCPTGRGAVVAAASAAGWPVRDGGTLVVIEGPRFSTRAESEWFRREGWTVVNMTGHPEAVLSRELALCYTAIAVVTDVDAGVEGGGVTQAEVLAEFARSIDALRALLGDVVPALPARDERDCACGHALDGIVLPIALP